MEATEESLEEKVEEGVCSECGTSLDDDGDPWPPARVEDAGDNLVNVTFQAMRAPITIARGISEVSWRYENLGDYLRRALIRQNKHQFAILQERDNLLDVLRDLGEEAAEAAE